MGRLPPDTMGTKTLLLNTVAINLPLPLELVEDILSLAWSSSLERSERSRLAAAISSSSRTLQTIFHNVQEADLHITNPIHAARLVRSIVDGHPSVQRCRRLTFSILSDTSLDPRQRIAGAAAIQAVLYLAHSANCFPHLSAVTLDLRALQASDVSSHLPTLFLPSSVHTLRITLAPHSPRPCVPNGRLAPPAPSYLRHGFGNWHTTHLQALVLDTPPAFADDLARACPDLRSLTLAWPRAQARWWETLVPLRSSVGALVLDVGKPDRSVRDGLERLAAVTLTRKVFVEGPGTLVVQVDGEARDLLLPDHWESVCQMARTKGLELSIRCRA